MKPEDMMILVVGSNHCWGRGDTLKEALENATKPKSYRAYIIHPDTRVTSMGYMEFPNDFPPKLFHEVGKGVKVT